MCFCIRVVKRQEPDTKISLKNLVAEARHFQELIHSLVVEPQVLGKNRINLFVFSAILHREKRDKEFYSKVSSAEGTLKPISIFQKAKRGSA